MEIILNLSETLDFIKSTAFLGSKPGLERLRKLLNNMGNPEKDLKYIHVAGTNGKGSTSAMIAGILKEGGYRVGLFTSPYLEIINEQIRINNDMITNEELIQTASEVKKSMDTLETEELPTEFEIITAIAFLYFNKKNCDFVVLETGLGGSLDATNVIPRKEVAVITNIGRDHIEFLGDSYSEIAKHKAGIICKDCITISYEQNNEVLNVLEEKCNQEKVELRIVDFSKITKINVSLKGQNFSYKTYNNLFIPLLGEHQIKNAVVAIETIKALNDLGHGIEENAIYQGLIKVLWPARFECLNEKPYVFLDGGHNVQCINELIKILYQFFYDKKIIFVTGVMKDKDYQRMYQLLAPYASEFIAVEPKNKRALSLSLLKEELEQYNKPVYACDSVKEGIKLSLEHANGNDVICAIGSLYMAGEIRASFKN